jgi:hypothetical protein
VYILRLTRQLAPTTDIDLTLSKSPYELPGTECWSIDPSANKELPLDFLPHKMNFLRRYQVKYIGGRVSEAPYD